ncbi:MAG: helix-turn-helix domain-containing protein [Treponema sp.]|nr:helix-turn-helix domain-containing protein [Treponema sp.]
MSNIDLWVGKRLEQAREKLGFSTQKAFSERLGLKYQSYVNYEKGERSLPDEIKLKLFEMGVNISWLITGQGNPLLDEQSEKIPLIEELQKIIDQTVEPIEARVSQLEAAIRRDKSFPETTADNSGPIYTFELAPAYGEEEEDREQIHYVWDIAAGPPIAQSEDRSETVAVPARLLRKGERYYAASVRGGSMAEAGIRDGDMVLIRFADVPRDGAIQVVRYQDKSTLKRLRKIEGKGWELHYEDGSGRLISCTSNDYEVQGEFVAILPGKSSGQKKRKSP